MRSESPVFTQNEVGNEQVIALDQPQYFPIIVVRMNYNDGSVGTATRWHFSDKERAAIAQGADLILTQPHQGAVMPIGLQLAFPNEYPLEGLD